MAFLFIHYQIKMTAELMTTITLLLLLSGDVETNPGPLDKNADFMPYADDTLLQAARSGNYTRAEECINHGADVNFSGRYNPVSPLLLAANFNHVDIVKLLLHHGANVNFQDKDKVSALWISAYLGLSHIVQVLLDSKAEVDVRCTWDEAPLCAAIRGRIEFKKSTSKSGLHLHSDFDCTVQLLLKYGAQISEFVWNDWTTQDIEELAVLCIAAGRGDVALVHKLLSLEININVEDQNNMTPLDHAISEKQQQVVYILLLHGARTRTYANLYSKIGLLCLSATSGHLNKIINIAESGVSINCKIKGMTPLHFALETQQTELVKFFLSQKANPNTQNEEGVTPLHSMVYNNFPPQYVKDILDLGANPNTEDITGVTPLHLAIEKGQSESIKILLEYEAEVSLLTAVECNNVEVAKTLLLAKKDYMKKRDVNGESALHKACANDNTEMVLLLIQHGAKPDAKDLFGKTPLMTAVVSRSFQVAELLLRGTDVKARDVNGWNAMHLAVREDNLSLARKMYLIDNSLKNDLDCHGYSPVSHISLGKRRYHKDEDANGDILASIEHNSNDDFLFLMQRTERCSIRPPPEPDKFRSKAVEFVQFVRAELSDGGPNKRYSASPDVTVKEVLKANGIGPCSQTPDIRRTIADVTERYMQDLTKEMNRLDSRLGLVHNFHGSSQEGTKVGLNDEFDCRLHITSLQGTPWKLHVQKELQHSVNLRFCPEAPQSRHKNGKKGSKHTENVEKMVWSTWGKFCNEKQDLLAPPLFKHMYFLMCIAIANIHGDAKYNYPLYLKDVRNEQVHFEWVGEPVDGMALKIDVVYVVTLRHWWPEKGNTHSRLLDGNVTKQDTNVLLRANGWRPSAALQELTVMAKMPTVLKYAYMLCKVINNLVEYTEQDKRNKVKSYHLKNALMFVADAHIQEKGSLDGCTDHVKLNKMKVQHFREIHKWAVQICESGLNKVMAGQRFYFRLGTSCLHLKQREKFMAVVRYLLHDENQMLSITPSTSTVGGSEGGAECSMENDKPLYDSDVKGDLQQDCTPASGLKVFSKHQEECSGYTTQGKHHEECSGDTSQGKHQEECSGDTSQGKHQEECSGDTTPDKHQEKCTGDTTPDKHQEKCTGDTTRDKHKDMYTGNTTLDKNQEKSTGDTTPDKHQEKCTGDTTRDKHQEKCTGDTTGDKHREKYTRYIKGRNIYLEETEGHKNVNCDNIGEYAVIKDNMTDDSFEESCKEGNDDESNNNDKNNITEGKYRDSHLDIGFLNMTYFLQFTLFCSIFVLLWQVFIDHLIN